ncbi:MAG: hypothetical protein KGN84_04680 [Acidobacteriota bacterium]|nr:hypothetical protein [Acidobacteriota bacterium]
MCPLFLPGAAMPLMNLFSGACAADPEASIPESKLRECCNRGYAREACGRAAEIEADAVRFLIKADRGGLVEVAWAMERNHHPVAVGTELAGSQAASNNPLALQVFALAEQYRKQKGAS